MKPHDFVKLKVPSSPEISPDATTVVFPLKEINEEDNSYSSSIYIKNLKNGEIERFTSGKKLDYNPKFSPDGNYLAFLSSRSEKTQIFVMKIDGGEAIKVTDFPTPIEDFRWNNDGTQFIVLSLVSSEDIKEILNPQKEPSFVLEPEEFEANKKRFL